MYDAIEDLLKEIRAGEDVHLDFKEVVFRGDRIHFAGEEGGVSTSEKIAKALTCFANTEGGVLIFGVTKNGEIIGIAAQKIDRVQELIRNVAQNHCDPPIPLLLDRIILPGRDGQECLCLKVEVKKAQFHVHRTSGGHYYYRDVDSCHDMSPDHLGRLMARREILVPFEERPHLRASLDALSKSVFEQYHQKRYRRTLEQSEITYDRLLRNLKLVEEDEAGTLHPTTLGLLLFCTSPHDYLGGAFVDLVAYDSLEPDANRQRDAKKITGTIVQQIERCVDYFKSSPFIATAAFKDGIGRKDIPMYSLRALHEGVVNALVHRDYQLTGSQVRIFLFPDRVEISSPGRLHNTIREEDLYAGCHPYRRNQLLAGFLGVYESPVTGRVYMEGRGEGFLMLVQESMEVSGRRPDFRQIGDSVKLTIYAGPPPEETKTHQ
jgi:predicted HTH transcriptional regulator